MADHLLLLVSHALQKWELSLKAFIDKVCSLHLCLFHAPFSAYNLFLESLEAESLELFSDLHVSIILNPRLRYLSGLKIRNLTY